MYCVICVPWINITTDSQALSWPPLLSHSRCSATGQSHYQQQSLQTVTEPTKRAYWKTQFVPFVTLPHRNLHCFCAAHSPTTKTIDSFSAFVSCFLSATQCARGGRAAKCGVRPPEGSGKMGAERVRSIWWGVGWKSASVSVQTQNGTLMYRGCFIWANGRYR